MRRSRRLKALKSQPVSVGFRPTAMQPQPPLAVPSPTHSSDAQLQPACGRTILHAVCASTEHCEALADDVLRTDTDDLLLVDLCLRDAFIVDSNGETAIVAAAMGVS